MYRYTVLAYLHVPNNLIEDITPLSGCKRLTGLTLNMNPLKDPTPIAKLTKLTSLALLGVASTDMALTSIDGLAGLSHLYSLDLGGNPDIADYAPLKKLRNLSHLHVDSSLSDKQMQAIKGFMKNCPVWRGDEVKAWKSPEENP